MDIQTESPDSDCASLEDESPEDMDSQDDETMNVSKNSAWADAMSEVLHSCPKTEKGFILAKAKHDAQIKKQKIENQIQIIDSVGQIVKDDSVVSSKSPHLSSKELRRKEMFEEQIKRKEWENMCRSKPDISNKEKERQLMKVATRSVVQLFNAVQKHQRKKDEKIQNVSSKKDALRKEKAVKGNFLDILKSSAVKPENPMTEQETRSKERTWSVLKDDFMVGTTLKDWDKSSDEDIQ